MSDKVLITYMQVMKEQFKDTMKRNAEMGREDFYTLGQIAVIDQLLHFIFIKERENV